MSGGRLFWGVGCDAVSKQPVSDVPSGWCLMGIWRVFGWCGVQSVMHLWVVRFSILGMYHTGGSYYEMPFGDQRDHTFLMWKCGSAQGQVRHWHVNVRMTFGSSFSLLCYDESW